MQTTTTNGQPYTILEIVLALKAKTLIATHFGITLPALEGRSRRQELNWPRFLCIYLIRKNTGLSTGKIGALFGRDHATIIHACYAVEIRCQTEAKAKFQLETLQTQFAKLL